jgi:hypothetical protein
MNKQRGVIALIWLYLAGAVLLTGALTGLVVAWKSYTTGLDRIGYDRGVAETTAAYQKRDNVALQAALAAQQRAEVRADQAERDAAAAQSVASSNYLKGVDDGRKKTAALVAAAHAGELRLRDPGARSGSSAACPPATGPASTASAPAGGDGAAGGELSAAAGEFLLSLAGEADDLARQLAAAQAVIVSDRALCNGP